MNLKTSWLFSWKIDLPFFFLLPIGGTLYFYFHFIHHELINPVKFFYVMLFVFAIDWGHFASIWPRIFLNQAETKSNRIKYSSFYFGLIAAFMLLCGFTEDVHHRPIFICLAYLAVFHTIKQQFGFLRLYSRFDKKKTRFENYTEQVFIYASMWTPVLYWHHYNTDPDGIWFAEFIKFSSSLSLFYGGAVIYAVSALFFIHQEWKRSLEDGFNISKNLCLLGTVLSWGMVSFLPANSLILMFTVQLHHNISYISVVWLMARRDRKMEGDIPFYSLLSPIGFMIYVPLIVTAGMAIFTIYREITFDLNKDYYFFRTYLNWIPKGQGWWRNLGYGIFFATQVHHFITDRWLWKKEKDVQYLKYLENKKSEEKPFEQAS